MKRNIVAILLLIIISFLSCKKDSELKIQLNYKELSLELYTIVYYDQEINFDTEIQQYFAEINQSLSTYIPTSDISRINRGEEGIKVDGYFREVFEKSARIYKETNAILILRLEIWSTLGVWYKSS